MDDNGQLPVEPEADHRQSNVEPSAEADRPSNDLGWTGVLVLVSVVALGRLAFSADRRIFQVSPDEPANLAMARWLSGTGTWSMFEADVQRPGFALLVAPLHWLTGDPATIYRGALVIGAVLAGWSAVYLALLVARMTALSLPGSAAVAALVMLAPNMLAASAHVWSEPLVVLAFLAVMWHTLSFVDEVSVRSGLCAVAWGSVGFSANTRMTAVLAVLVAVLGVISVRRERWRLGAGLLVVLGMLTAATLWLGAWVTDNVWEDPGDANTLGTVVSRFDSPLAIVDAAIGQSWYLMASTALLAGLGAIELALAIGRRSSLMTRRADALVIAVFTLSVVFLSVVFQSGGIRPDHLVYGRYNDSVIAPVVALGWVWLVSALSAGLRGAAVRFGATSAALVVLGLVLEVRHGDTLDQGGLRSMVPGIQHLRGSGLAIEPVRISIGALAIALVLAAVATIRSSRIVAAAGVTAVVVASGVFAWIGTEGTRNPTTAADVAELRSTLDGKQVGFVIDESVGSVPLQAAYGYLYQWYLDDSDFVGGDDAGRLDYFFAPDVGDGLDDRLGDAATIIWRDPTVSLALWCRPCAVGE